jgi:iron complex outermembrane recepter protein
MLIKQIDLRALLSTSALAVLTNLAIHSPAQADATSSSTDDDNANGSSLSEVVVTAERRSERAQDVPIAVTAVTASQLAQAGVTSLANLDNLEPSLSFQRRGSQFQTILRGLGSPIGDVNGESSVAMYVDGVYQPTGGGNWSDFNGIDRIEVLKGPQGTLFGRNTTGGVVQIITTDPSTTTRAGETSIDFANYNTYTLKGYGSTPLSDSTAANVSLLFSDQLEGWGRNLTTGSETDRRHELGLRGKFLLTPSEQTRVVLAADYFHDDNGGANTQPVPGALTLTGQGYPGRYNTWSGFENGMEVENWGVSATAEHDFGAAELRSISAYRNFAGLWNFDADGSPVDFIHLSMHEHAAMISQELHLLAPSQSRFQWLVGAFFFHYDPAQDPIDFGGQFFPTPGLDQYTRTTTRSMSAFAQGTYPVANDTNLTLGLRNTWDHIDYDGYSTLLDSTQIIVPSSGVPKTGTYSYSKPSWRVSLDHHFDTNVMGYASYNRGVKSGNYGLSESPSAVATYAPEQLDAYETGLKLETLHQLLNINSAVFYYDGKNIQYSRVINGTATIVSGAAETIYGDELSAELHPTRSLTLNAGVTMLHGTFGNFPNAPSTIRLPDGIDIAGPATFNAKGNTTPFAAKFVENVGFSYLFPATALGVFTWTTNAYFNSGYPTEIDNRLRIGAYSLLNSSLEWNLPDNHWYLRAWGSNLTNTYYYSQLQGQTGGPDVGFAAAPRTYGLTFGVRL